MQAIELTPIKVEWMDKNIPRTGIIRFCSYAYDFTKEYLGEWKLLVIELESGKLYSLGHSEVRVLWA